MENISISSKNSIDNDKDLGYSTSSKKKYWCHLCKKEFSKLYIPNIDIQCNYCGNTFCEELDNNTNINSESHPINFEPFSMRSSNNNNNPIIFIQHNKISKYFFHRHLKYFSLFLKKI